jgi:hypothetical protein
MKTIKPKAGGRLIRFFSISMLVLLAVHCTGPEGPMGPPGFDGQDGLDGTAYAYSVIYDVFPEDWIGNADGYRVFLDVPEITDVIYYEGAVLVYRLIEIDPISFNMLPYTYVDNALTVYMDYDAYVGGLDLIYKEVFEGINDTFAPVSLMSFKILIIEGIPLATLKTKVDVSDFDAVSRFLNSKNDFNKRLIY